MFRHIAVYYLSAGDVPVNDPSVSMESSQFSSEVLVTQVNMYFLSIFSVTLLFTHSCVNTPSVLEE